VATEAAVANKLFPPSCWAARKNRTVGRNQAWAVDYSLPRRPHAGDVVSNRPGFSQQGKAGDSLEEYVASLSGFRRCFEKQLACWNSPCIRSIAAERAKGDCPKSLCCEMSAGKTIGDGSNYRVSRDLCDASNPATGGREQKSPRPDRIGKNMQSATSHVRHSARNETHLLTRTGVALRKSPGLHPGIFPASVPTRFAHGRLLDFRRTLRHSGGALHYYRNADHRRPRPSQKLPKRLSENRVATGCVEYLVTAALACVPRTALVTASPRRLGDASPPRVTSSH